MSDALAMEIDALRASVLADLGQHDVDHVRRVARLALGSAAAGRVLLHVGVGPATFVLGTSALGVAKILEMLELGHNVMHGQYDWTRDPDLGSRRYEPDSVCTGDDWRRAHNAEHHVFTNVLGMDRDIGFSYFRVHPEQPWRPRHLLQVPVAAVLAVFFQWGIGLHACRADEILSGARPLSDAPRLCGPFVKKAAWQVFKDYVFYPALALGNAPRVAVGNLVANTLRNVWAFAIVFCGHFPEGVQVYPRTDHAETRGEFYARQIQGSANLEGGRWVDLLIGHVSHQIEHHLFPDLPASRYPTMAPKIREICARHGLRYVSGGLMKQLSEVGLRLLRLSWPSSPRRTHPPTAALEARVEAS